MQLKPVQTGVLYSAIEVDLFGATYNWNPSYHKAAGTRISEIARKKGVKIGSPIPSFDADIVSFSVLEDEVEPGFFRGVKADGVVLEEPGQAYALANADCPAVIIRDPASGVTLGLHAGRESLYDRKRLLEGVPGREFGSVIQNGVAVLTNGYGADPAKLQAYIALAIGPEHFEHPTTLEGFGGNEAAYEKYADANKRMLKHFAQWSEDAVPDFERGLIDITQVVKGQLRELGVRDIATDDNDTYADTDSSGEPVWHSNRRDDPSQRRRNLVLAIRCE